jgi:hypothetical protein
MDWTEIATKADLALVRSDLVAFEERFDLKLDSLEHRVVATFESALRTQTQWMVGALGAMALSLFGTVLSVLAWG